MNFGSLLKIVISVAMVTLALMVVDLPTLAATMRGMPASVILTAIVGFSLTQLISCIKWWLLARAGGIECSYLTAVRAFFVGMFANCFGLGTLGGDVLRGVVIAQGAPKKTEAMASVVADRALGLTVLALIGLLASTILGAPHLDRSLSRSLSVFAAIIIAGWFIGPPLMLRLVPRGNRLRTKIEQALAVFPKDPRLMLLIAGISAIFHLSQIYLILIIARELGLNTPFQALLVTIPFVNILSTLPISWNGVGVRENAYLFFLTPEIFSREQAVTIGAIWLLGITGASLLGGVLAVLTGDIRHFLKRKDVVAQAIAE